MGHTQEATTVKCAAAPHGERVMMPDIAYTVGSTSLFRVDVFETAMVACGWHQRSWKAFITPYICTLMDVMSYRV